MAYFLRQDKRKKGIYLQICDSNRIKGTKKNKTTVYKTLGYLEDLIANGESDPVKKWKDEIQKMNEARKQLNKQKIGDATPTKNIGYMMVDLLFKKLDVFKDLKLFDLVHNKDTKYTEVLRFLIHARIIEPKSKCKTYQEVFSKMHIKEKISLDDVYDALDFYGNDFQKVIEAFNKAATKIHQFDYSKVLFDCTNFYFEIDKEDELRRRGPSKELRHDPLVGLALLLDGKAMPIGMNLYPGNKSEKPELRKILNDTKKRYNVEGRTIQIADKGLNCAKNIHSAKISGDGYIFSRAVLNLSNKELTRLKLDHQYEKQYDKNGNVAFMIKEAIDDYEYSYEENKETIAFKTQEKRIITWNRDLAIKKLAELEKIETKARELILSRAKREMFGYCGDFIDLKCFNKDGELIEEKITSVLKEAKLQKHKDLAGYNMIITSEINESKEKIYSFYHQLWRIEKTFRVMKTDLQSRPVYLRKETTIHCHFLICYLAVLALNLLQQDVFNGEFSIEEIIEFIKDFNVTLGYGDIYTNTLKKSKFSTYLAEQNCSSITNLYLTEKDIGKIEKTILK